MQPITIEQYAGKFITHPDFTPERRKNAESLLIKVNKSILLASAIVKFQINPHTGSLVAGTQYGGFRPQDCPEGKPGSTHKNADACDVYDPFGAYDIWCLCNEKVLIELGLWMEHPLYTQEGWAHQQQTPPHSGNRYYIPG